VFFVHQKFSIIIKKTFSLETNTIISMLLQMRNCMKDNDECDGYVGDSAVASAAAVS